MERDFSFNWRKEQWVLKCDVRKFFDSIDHSILQGKIKQYNFDSDTVRLIDCILSSFEKTPGKGLPLGNVTSQLFANIYLNDFDWFIKQKLGIQYYFRYCDDFIVLLKNRQESVSLLDSIKYEFTKLSLMLHPDKISLRKVRQGIDFLGYVIVPHGVLLRTTTKKRIYRKTLEIKNKNMVDSYLGVSTHAKERLLTTKLLQCKALLDKEF